MFKNKIPPPVILLLLIGCVFLLKTYLPLFFLPLPKLMGIGLIAMGGVLDVVSFYYFVRAKTTVNPLKPDGTSALVVVGFYRWSRNPMYLGMLFVLIGVTIYWQALSAIVTWPLFVLIINDFQILPEEQVLRHKFGEDYSLYSARVRRWL